MVLDTESNARTLEGILATNRQTTELGSKTLILYKIAEPDKSQLPSLEVVTLKGFFPWLAFVVKKGDF